MCHGGEGVPQGKQLDKNYGSRRWVPLEILPPNFLGTLSSYKDDPPSVPETPSRSRLGTQYGVRLRREQKTKEGCDRSILRPKTLISTRKVSSFGQVFHIGYTFLVRKTPDPSGHHHFSIKSQDSKKQERVREEIRDTGSGRFRGRPRQTTESPPLWNPTMYLPFLVKGPHGSQAPPKSW